MKDGQKGGRKERGIESERGLRNGGWWRHREETMNTKGKNEPRNNQTFINNLVFFLTSLHFIEVERVVVTSDVTSHRFFPRGLSG